VLRHPERTITSDTLHYTTTTGLAEFFGPTTITSGEVRMWCTRGSYDTRREFARFTRRAKVLSNAQELHGDSLHYDRTSGLGRAWGHVLMLDTTNEMEVRGDAGLHDESRDLSWVTGNAELVMKLGEDSLHLHGDTLFASGDSAGRTITARRNVRFFKSDMQGACDTMTYSDVDSVIHLRSSPVLWSGDDQITGREIRIALRDGRAHRLFVDHDAFLASQADSLHFDQVTGTSMTGSFTGGELRELIAEGNCRTVYFPLDEADSTIIGMNRVDCSRIRVAVTEGEANEIAFLAKPDGTMYPLEQAPPEEMRLRGFIWRGAERPVDRAAIFQ
jgi:lipopolysaccharide export system protein LptA